jgi:hypothetical protein
VPLHQTVARGAVTRLVGPQQILVGRFFHLDRR